MSKKVPEAARAPPRACAPAPARRRPSCPVIACGVGMCVMSARGACKLQSNKHRALSASVTCIRVIAFSAVREAGGKIRGACFLQRQHL